MQRVTRRSLGRLLGVVGLSTSGSAFARRARAGGPVPWSLIAPFCKGADIGLGWRVADLLPIARGAAGLILEHVQTGTCVRVDLCRRIGPARGLAHTRDLDLFLMNGANGAAPSEEDLGRAILSLAAAIDSADAHPPLNDLLSHEERLAVFGPACDLDGAY